MTDEKSLVIQPQLNLTSWQVIQAIAPTMHQSRLFGVASAEQAAAIMIKGAELGLGFAASYEYIHIIQNKPTLSPRGALALVLASGKLDGFKVDATAERASCWMKRGTFEYTETMTIDNARKAGLVKADSGWEKWPKNMLRWRVIGFCIDLLYPDITGGLKRSDEFGADIDDGGNVVTASAWTTAPAPASTPAPAPTAPVPTLEDLVNQYGADVVMSAANGQIPGTDEEVAIVATILGASANA